MRNYLLLSFCLFLLMIFVLGGCLTATGGGSGTLSERQVKLVDAAYWAKGRGDLSNNGKIFLMDCSGSMLAIYWKAGIDLSKAYTLYSGNGVQRIYAYLDKKGLLTRSKYLSPGDLIFWDNTHDFNGNGRSDDQLTHVGMVVSISPGGGIVYIHYDYYSGMVFAKMNLTDPSNPEKNTSLRLLSLGPTLQGYMTSGELFHKAGKAWKLSPER